jgi:hypothetical protein
MKSTAFSSACWLVVLHFVMTSAGPAMAECEGEMISMLVSPDDGWVALVQEVVCSGEGFGTTAITDGVQIVRRGEVPEKGNDVFGVDEGGRAEIRPLTRWLSPQKLQITVPNKSLIGLQKSSYEGIEIVIKFEPDDPAERERWLNSHGLPRLPTK